MSQDIKDTLSQHEDIRDGLLKIREILTQLQRLPVLTRIHRIRISVNYILTLTDMLIGEHQGMLHHHV